MLVALCVIDKSAIYLNSLKILKEMWKQPVLIARGINTLFTEVKISVSFLYAAGEVNSQSLLHVQEQDGMSWLGCSEIVHMVPLLQDDENATAQGH